MFKNVDLGKAVWPIFFCRCVVVSALQSGNLMFVPLLPMVALLNSTLTGFLSNQKKVKEVAALKLVCTYSNKHANISIQSCTHGGHMHTYSTSTCVRGKKKKATERKRSRILLHLHDWFLN